MKKVIADCHADTIEFCLDNNMKLKDRKLSFNTQDVFEFLPYIQCLSCFIHDKYLGNGYKRFNDIFNKYIIEKEKNSHIIQISNTRDIENVVQNNKLGVMLTVENATVLDGNLDNLYRLYNKGVKMMSITWNGDNQLGCGSLTEQDIGLKSLGKKCINLMNEIDMIIDISHASYKTFWDVLSCTSKPVIASHSNVYNICKNKRNLTDIQIKEIAKASGMIGVTYCSTFLTNNKQGTVQDVVNHISYICELVGIEYVCLGSDFEGTEKDKLPQNLKGIKDIHKLEECLLYNGFNSHEIQRIMGGNLIGFLQNNI